MMPISPTLVLVLVAFLLVARRLQLDPGLVAVAAGGAVARFWEWSSLGLDIFDSGAYAVSAQALAADLYPAAGYPTQHLLSPPFHFGSAGMLMKVVGATDAALIGLSAVFGIATVVLVHAFTREVFGREAALVASALVAFGDFHVLFSRSGMTDVTFGFWLLFAVLLFAESERRESFGWAVMAGLATGCAWNTKTHGWLAVAVAALAVTLGARELGRRGLVRAYARIAVAAGVAVLLYIPWAIFSANLPGGYGQMVDHYSAYLQPLEIPGHVWQHLRLQMTLDGWMGRIGVGFAAAWLVVATPSLRRGTATARAAAVVGAAFSVGPVVLAGLAALFAVVALARSRPDARARALLSLFAVFTVLTPVYYPYARLTLPWLLASHILAGAAIVRWIHGSEASDGIAWPVLSRPLRVSCAAGFVVIAAVCVSLRPPWTSAATFRSQTGLRTAAEELVEIVPPGSTTLIWAEPALVFYLRNRLPGVFSIHDPREIARYAALGRPVYLVSSIYAARTSNEPGTREWLAANGGRLEPAGVVPVDGLSNVRLINDWSGSGAREIRRGEFAGYDLFVSRVRPE